MLTLVVSQIGYTFVVTIIFNKSKCGICGNVIKKEKDIVGFPHYVGDENDPLFYFSDGGFHEACFLSHPLKDRVLAAKKKYDEEIHLPPKHE